MSLLELLENPLFWLSIGLILILLELIIPGVFLLWVGLGALMVTIPTYLIDPIAPYASLLLFVPSVVLMVWLGILWQRKAQNDRAKVNVGLSSYVGTTARVASVDPERKHEIRIWLAGTTYPATCEQTVGKNDYVKITAVHDGEIIVRPKKRPKNHSKA